MIQIHDTYMHSQYQELIMCRGEYLMLYSPVIEDCAEVNCYFL